MISISILMKLAVRQRLAVDGGHVARRVVKKCFWITNLQRKVQSFVSHEIMRYLYDIIVYVSQFIKSAERKELLDSIVDIGTSES
jgi:hypothetical protein